MNIKIGNKYKAIKAEGVIFGSMNTIYVVKNILPYNRWAKYNICLVPENRELCKDAGIPYCWVSEEEIEEEYVKL